MTFRPFIFISLCLLLLGACFAFESLESLKATMENKLTKYCPLRNFNGALFCPSQQSSKSNNDMTVYLEDYKISDNSMVGAVVAEGAIEVPPETQTQPREQAMINKTWEAMPQDARLISGFGFDRVKRTIKFPVVPTREQPEHAPSVDSTTNRYGQPQDFLNAIFRKSNNFFEAGLFVQQDSIINDLAYKFSDYKQNIGVTQRHYNLWKNGVKSETALPEFVEIVNSLPPWNVNDGYVRQMYNMLIEFFGTDVAVDTVFGGVVYQQTAIKSCYGGSVTEGMLQDIDAFIRKLPPGNSAYARYRSLSHLNVLGGNPEFGSDRINERVNTFGQAPAVIKFHSRPLSDFVSDPTRRSWVQQAVQQYINENLPNIDRIVQDIQNRKQQQFKGVQPIGLIDYGVEQGGNFICYWIGCAIIRGKNWVYTPHCALLRSPIGMAAGGRQNSGSSWYDTQAILERDPASGFVRHFVTFRGQQTFASAWTGSGCTRSQFGPRLCLGRVCINTYERLFKYACLDCMPFVKQIGNGQHGTIHTVPDCVCQGFN